MIRSVNVEKKKALIIDDSKDFKQALKKQLERLNFEVTECSSIKHASSKVTSDFFDHIFIDCLLPDGDGLEYSKKLNSYLHQKESSSLLHIVSGVIELSSLSENYDYITSFLKKPIDHEELKKALDIKNSKDSNFIKKVFSAPSSKTLEIYQEHQSLDEAFLITPLIFNLCQKEEAHKIEIISEQNRYSLIFAKGKLCRIDLQDFESSIGELLVSLGYLMETDLSAHIKSNEFKSQKIKMGQSLISKNLISPHSINIALRFQLKTRLIKVLREKHISYRVERVSPLKETLGFTIYELFQNSLAFFQSIEGSGMIKNLSQKFDSLNLREGILSSAYIENNLDLQKKINENLDACPDSLHLTPMNYVFLSSECLKLSSKSDFSEEIENESTQIFLRNLVKRIQIECPYTVFKINPKNTNDREIAEKYHKIAKKIHPDKLKALKIDLGKGIDATGVFTKLTEHFNKIKTASKRRDYEIEQENKKLHQQEKLNEIFFNAKSLLEKGQGDQAYALLNSPEFSENHESIKDFKIYFLWSKIVNEPDSIVRSDAEPIIYSSFHTESPEVYAYVEALYAQLGSKSEVFKECIEKCLKLNPSFLPARRALIAIKEQGLKAATRNKKGFFSSYRKSS